MTIYPPQEVPPSAMPYWQWPKFKCGDAVQARLHNGAIRYGRITHVETHYSLRTNEPYHIYSFRWPGSSRSQHLGEASILQKSEAGE